MPLPRQSFSSSQRDLKRQRAIGQWIRKSNANKIRLDAPSAFGQAVLEGILYMLATYSWSSSVLLLAGSGWFDEASD